MNNKPLWRISIATTFEAEDAAAEMLGAILTLAASSYFNLETGVSTTSVFCERKPAGNVRKEISDGLRQIQNCGLQTGPGKISITRVRREDWAESWKRHFKPIEIAGALLVKPSWSKRRREKNQAVIVLDPGLSFGTGQHPTTSFCLQQIVAAVGKPPRISKLSFLDIGTGSGILAIAAAKLGCSPVDAFDFDPAAVGIARENARLNGVAGKVRLARRDVKNLPPRPARKYALICANLISNLLIAEAGKIAAQLQRGGVLVLAGILKAEFAAVEKSFAALGLKLVAGRTENEWRSGAFRFRQNLF